MLSTLPVIARFRGLLSGLLTGNADDRNVLKASFKQASLLEQATAIATAFTLAEESTDTDSCMILVEWARDALNGYDEDDAPGFVLPIERLWYGANQYLLEFTSKTPDRDALHKLTIASVALAGRINMRASELV